MRSRSTSRVVPGISVTIAASCPASAFRRLDFPAFGRPAITTCSPSRSALPCRTVSAIAAKRLLISSSRFAHFRGCEEFRVLVREVDRAFHIGAKLHHARRERLDLARKISGERPQGRARRFRRSCRYQVGDRLRLHEVQLFIVEGALGELPGPRMARAELDRPRDEKVHDDRAAMPLQFEHVFTRE